MNFSLNRTKPLLDFAPRELAHFFWMGVRMQHLILREKAMGYRQFQDPVTSEYGLMGVRSEARF